MLHNPLYNNTLPTSPIRAPTQCLRHGTFISYLTDQCAWTHQRRDRDLTADALEWQELLTYSADAIWALDEEDRIIAWNRAAERMFGYTREEILGSPHTRLIPDDLIEAREPERLKKALTELGAVRDYQTRRVTKSGCELEVSLTRTVHQAGRSGKMASATIVRDLSERRAIENQMIEAEKLAALGELAASVAQEIGAPLTTIGLALDGLRKVTGDGRDCRRQLDTIDRSLKRIARLSRGLVELARPGELVLRSVSVEDVLAAALELAGPSLDRAGVEVEIRIDGGLPEIRADSGQLQQVFLHLLMNAQRALEETDKGQITVCARLDRGLPAEGRPIRRDLAIDFTDNGPGIDPSDLPFIFSPFFSRSGGSGLGLPLAKQVIHAHRGSLSVDSTRGAGTTMTIHLPVDTDE